MDFIQEPVMTSSVVVQRRGSKALPKVKLVPKKVIVTVWWSAAGLLHYSFLNPGETITSERYAQQSDKMHQKLRGLQPALTNRKSPILCDNARQHVAQPTFQKRNELGYEILPHPAYSSDLCQLTTTSIITIFAGKAVPQPAGGKKCFLRIC